MKQRPKFTQGTWEAKRQSKEDDTEDQGKLHENIQIPFASAHYTLHFFTGQDANFVGDIYRASCCYKNVKC